MILARLIKHYIMYAGAGFELRLFHLSILWMMEFLAIRLRDKKNYILILEEFIYFFS
jgi:hypothetical protein